MNRFLERLGEAAAPLLVAHRGASAPVPENTLLAAERAWRDGAVAWEFDVHLSRDGVPVVIHDESLLRTTDVAERFPDDPRRRRRYPVSAFDFDEIRRLDAGAWFLREPGPSRSAARFGTAARLDPADVDAIEAGAARVPGLDEALEWTARRDGLANVEIKSFPDLRPELLDAALAVIGRLGVADRVLVSSFHHEDVARARRSPMPIATGVLFDAPLFRPERYIRELVGADCAHPGADALGAASDGYRADPGPDRLRGDVVRALREAELPVLVYTVNAPGLARHLAAVGVSALFTDDPGRLRAAIAPR